jgi:hypothetical protein
VKESLKESKDKLRRNGRRRVSIPQFSGEEDDFCLWFLRAKTHAYWFGFTAAMDINAEAQLPAAERPGVTAAKQAAVERNMNAAAFLTSTA